jgi:hypothetical protein
MYKLILENIAIVQYIKAIQVILKNIHVLKVKEKEEDKIYFFEYRFNKNSKCSVFSFNKSI